MNAVDSNGGSYKHVQTTMHMEFLESFLLFISIIFSNEYKQICFRQIHTKWPPSWYGRQNPGTVKISVWLWQCTNYHKFSEFQSNLKTNLQGFFMKEKSK